MLCAVQYVGDCGGWDLLAEGVEGVGGSRRLALFVGGVGGTEGDALCAALYVGGTGGDVVYAALYVRCRGRRTLLLEVLEVQEILDVVCRTLLCMLEARGCALCALRCRRVNTVCYFVC